MFKPNEAFFRGMGQDFIPSKEQESIFDTLQHGIGNIIVNAVAGSGKSTVIKGCALLVPDNKRFIVLSHNKDVADKMRFSLLSTGIDEKRFTVRTFHALGYKILRDCGLVDIDNEGTIDDNKYMSYISGLDKAANGYVLSLKEKVALKSVIDFARQNLAQDEYDIHDVIEKYGIIPFPSIEETALSIMEWGKNAVQELGLCDYLDMLWYPCEGISTLPRYFQFDYVFVDEAQDASPAQQAMVKRLIGRSTRLIIMGDRYQAINTWCGSDERAMDNFKRLGAKWTELPLSTNYRCGKAILSNAMRTVEKYNFGIVLNPCDNAPEGEIIRNAHVEQIRENDMVLCRHTYPLFQLYARLTEMGIRAEIRGENIAQRILTILSCSKSDNIEDIIRETAAMGLDGTEPDNDEDIRGNTVMCYEMCQIFKILSMSCSTKDDAKRYIEKAFITRNQSGVVSLSTMHRAKGLEANNVFIAYPELLPSPMCKDDNEWQMEMEKNLEYVALTRAKKKLFFLNSNEIPLDQSFLNKGKIKKKLYEYLN